ncbi:hypothetical protein Tco_1578263 [Tanacetum coccineum]
MGDENLTRTLGDYSKPSHEGYMNIIELPVRNNVVPLRSDTIRLVQNGCSFHGLWSEDPNQHLKDFIKLVDSLDLDDEVGGKKFTSNQGPRNFYDAANTGGEKLNFNWKYTQTSTSPHGGLISIYSSSYQMKLEKALLDFDSHQNKSQKKDKIGTDEEVEEVFEDEESEMETEEEVEEVFDDETKEKEDEDTKHYNSPPAIKELIYHE